jgi:hypothetical protein
MVQAVNEKPIIPLSAIIQKTMVDNGTMEPQEKGLQPKKGVIQTPFGAQTHGGNSHYPIIQKPIGLDNGNLDNGTGAWGEVDPDFGDDRVECKHCSFFKQEMATQRFPADVWDKIVRVNHPANQWMFELAKVKDGWVTVTYPRSACYGGEPAPMPVGLKHRCDYFQPFNEVAIENATKEWWEQ